MQSPDTIGRRLWRFFSGFGLATFLLVTIGVLTWFATLEQVDSGLFVTLHKYFHWTSWYVVPEIGGKSIFIPFPGGYWVCALLLVNMILGGLIRARKGWKTVGVLMSHFGIIFMVAAGGVAQLLEKRGVMMLVEGERADYAISLTDPTIELMEIADGEARGEVSVASASDLGGLAPADRRVIDFPGRPFDLEISGWETNAMVRPATARAGERAVGGWMLDERRRNIESELDTAGCYARAIFEDGTKGEPFILAVAPPSSGLTAYPPQLVEAGGARYAVRMVKATIPVPYTVRLEDAVAEYYPNSGRPKEFLSDIERIGPDGTPVDLRISMNEPMRQGGFTLFQRTMSSGPANGPGPEFSGFEVVSNPADRWPEYSLYLVTLGLFVHFVMKLARHLGGSGKAPTQASS